MPAGQEAEQMMFREDFGGLRRIEPKGMTATSGRTDMSVGLAGR